MTLDSFLKSIQSKLTHKKKEATCTPRLAEPTRDWKILLIVFTILLLVLVGYSGIVYLQVKKGPDGGSDLDSQSVSVPKLDEKALESILSLRDVRAQMHADYLQGM